MEHMNHLNLHNYTAGYDSLSKSKSAEVKINTTVLALMVMGIFTAIAMCVC